MSDVDEQYSKGREHVKIDTAKSQPSNEKSKCNCLLSCCANESSGLDDELLQILSEKKQKNSTAQPSDPESVYRIFKDKKDGCTESGYLYRTGTSSHPKSLEKIRKSCTATKNLSSPEIAIKMNNSKQVEKLNNKVKKSVSGEERHVSEINEMLVHRLSSLIVLDDVNPSESGEALLSYKAINSNIQPHIISQLVHGADLTTMSSSTEVDRSRRRSSFSLKNVDKTIKQNPYEKSSSKNNNKLNNSNDSDFINNLPKISVMVKNELEYNLHYTQKYIKKLKAVFKNSNAANLVEQRRKENWVVILYTTSEEINRSLTEFDCNLVRLILQHHRVAYEERDIALRKLQFKKELQTNIDSDRIKVPCVFAKGIYVGGVQVIFVMHRMKLIEEFFKDYIIAPDIYVDWLYKRSKDKSILNLNVKISGFPALKQMLHHYHGTNLTKSDHQIVKSGKNILKEARSKWNVLSKNTYTQPSLFKLVLLRNTIILVYTILNNLYFYYLPGQSKADLWFRCCR